MAGPIRESPVAEVPENRQLVFDTAKNQINLAISVDIASRHARTIVKSAVGRRARFRKSIREGDSGLSEAQRCETGVGAAGGGQGLPAQSRCCVPVRTV